METIMKKEKLRVGIIFGGKSGEHEISLMSAFSVISAIDKEKYSLELIGITKKGRWLYYDGPYDLIENGKWQEYAENKLKEDEKKYELVTLGNIKNLKDKIDIAFPVLHGPFGEDGTIQGLFEMADIPYVGCKVLGSSVAMDKGISKKLFEMAGIPVCKYIVIDREDIEDNIEEEIRKIEENIPYPAFIKPANLGSSVGISKAENKDELIEGIKEACKFDRRLVIEEGLNCREIEVGVIGNARPLASEVGEIIASKDFYDYEAKYFDGGKSQMCIPAEIDFDTREKLREEAIKAYKALDLKGFSRVDFFLERNSGKIYLNEINTIPGFTKFSMFPSLWNAVGVAYSDLIDKLIQYGLEG